MVTEVQFAVLADILCAYMLVDSCDSIIILLGPNSLIFSSSSGASPPIILLQRATLQFNNRVATNPRQAGENEKSHFAPDISQP